MALNVRYISYLLFAIAAVITLTKLTLNPPHLPLTSPPLQPTTKHGDFALDSGADWEASSKPGLESKLEVHQPDSSPLSHIPPTIFTSSILSSASESTSEPTTEFHSKPKITNQENAKHAFVVFLEANTEHEDIQDDEDDEYFLATRVVGYQLMHAPHVKTNTSIPFLVACTSGVSKHKRARLEKDGAIVLVVDDVFTPTWVTTPNVRWQALMTKLRVFQLTQYEKILLFDSDVLPVRRMDGIFDDEATNIISPLEERETKEDEAPLPSTYMLAAQLQARDWTHDYPPGEGDNYFGAGFFVAAPSKDIFDYYMSVLAIKDRFETYFMEQDLMNYAHRKDGPMPWKSVHYKWTTTFPTINDYAAGARSLHHKFWWKDSNTKDHGLDELRDMWYQARWEMEGYYRGLEEAER